MFTGLIKEIATVTSFHANTLTLNATYRPNIGDSIAINGACLTVTHLHTTGFSVELSNESSELLALERFNAHVHIEPAMQQHDRFDGHMVQGHIDAIGTIITIVNSARSTDVHIRIDAKYMPLIIEKGSIAIDGVSLTINTVYDDSFRLTIIPLTRQATLFNQYKKGMRVNIETDIIARTLWHQQRYIKEAATKNSDAFEQSIAAWY